MLFGVLCYGFNGLFAVCFGFCGFRFNVGLIIDLFGWVWMSFVCCLVFIDCWLFCLFLVFCLLCWFGVCLSCDFDVGCCLDC